MVMIVMPMHPTIQFYTMNKALGLSKDQSKQALEKLKSDLVLPNDFHGKIQSNGDYIDPNTGDVLGNLKDYLP